MVFSMRLPTEIFLIIKVEERLILNVSAREEWDYFTATIEVSKNQNFKKKASAVHVW